MKELCKILFLLFVLISCNSVRNPKDPSFAVVEDFIQKEKAIERFNINAIDVARYHLTDYKKFNSNNIDLETRTIKVVYDLKLHGDKKSYLSKAEVTSSDSINWKINRLTITGQTDSMDKHFEKTMVWENPDATTSYDVLLQITDN